MADPRGSKSHLKKKNIGVHESFGEDEILRNHKERNFIESNED